MNISDAEFEILQALWQADEPVSAQRVSEILKAKNWKYTTIATLLGRMVEKGSAAVEKHGRVNFYIPSISEKEYKKQQTKNYVTKLYNGSVKNLVASLCETGGMTSEDIEEIKERFNL